MVTMHGPAFDGSGNVVERQVPENDVQAYANAGYRVGKLPEWAKPLPEPVKTDEPKKAAKKVKDTQ